MSRDVGSGVVVEYVTDEDEDAVSLARERCHGLKVRLERSNTVE